MYCARRFARDAAARTFSSVFTLDEPRDPATWPTPTPRPVPKFTLDVLALGNVLSALGKDLLDMVCSRAQQQGIKIQGIPDDPNVEIPPENIVEVLQNTMGVFFPTLVPPAATAGANTTADAPVTSA